jgi:hypothetical protein
MTSTYKVFRERTSDGIKYGIGEGSNGLLYDADFEKKEQAQAICDAHNNGAESYEQACEMAGLDPVTLQPDGMSAGGVLQVKKESEAK